MPGVASTGPVDAALDPKSTLQKVSGEEIGLPQGSKTPTFGTATGVLLTPLFEGAGGQDKGAPDSARLTRAETGGAQVQKDYFVRPSASDMSRSVVKPIAF